MNTSETVTLDELIACQKELTAEEKPSGGFGVLAIQGGRIIILLKHEAEALLATVEAMRDHGLAEMAALETVEVMRDDCLAGMDARSTYRKPDSLQAFCRAAVRLSRRLEDKPDLFDHFIAQALWNYSHGVFELEDAAGWAEKFVEDVAKSREILDRVESLKSKDLDRLIQWINKLDCLEADSEPGNAVDVTRISQEVEA